MSIGAMDFMSPFIGLPCLIAASCFFWLRYLPRHSVMFPMFIVSYAAWTKPSTGSVVLLLHLKTAFSKSLRAYKEWWKLCALARRAWELSGFVHSGVGCWPCFHCKMSLSVIWCEFLTQWPPILLGACTLLHAKALNCQLFRRANTFPPGLDTNHTMGSYC